MPFSANSYQLSTILNRRIYVIPEFQREYSWEKEELETFWNDLFVENDGSLNFFWSVVLVWGDYENAKWKFEIIDWQQRITTFLLLINRIIARFFELWDEKLAKALENRLKFSDDDAKEYLVLENENAYSFFQEILFHNNDTKEIISQSEEAKKLAYAKTFFHSQLQKIQDIDELIKIREILLGITIIVVVQDSEEKAFETFETLNFRGMDLNILDLVKTFIVRNYPKKTWISDPRDTWKLILWYIKEDKRNFFNRYWSLRYSKVSDWKLYSEFRTITKSWDQEKARELLYDLKNISEIYADVLKPENAVWLKYLPDNYKLNDILKHSIQYLKSFQVKVHLPLLIWLLEQSKTKTINYNQLLRWVKLMEFFHFIFNAICSRRPSWMDKKYSKYAIALSLKPRDTDKIIDSLKSELAEKLPSKNEFIENFAKLNYEDNKSLILYIFRILESKYQSWKLVSLQEESLDHLSTQDEWHEWCHNIGNLCLLEIQLNNDERRNKKLKDSIHILKKSSYESTKIFCSKWIDDMTEEICLNRAQELGEEVYDFLVLKISKL